MRDGVILIHFDNVYYLHLTPADKIILRKRKDLHIIAT